MPQLLLILSHVVHGYVGNRAIVFPLQYCGWDADAINTTHFSNHPGYGSFEGSKTPASAVADIIEGLEDILNVNSYHLLVTGYAPTAETLQVIIDKLKPLDVPWLMDPVLGDNGKLYVESKLIPMYQDILRLGRVSLVTPNQFEFEMLVGESFDLWSQLRQAVIKFFEQYKVKHLVISLVILEGKMWLIGASSSEMFAVPIEEVPCHFSGLGDLFCAILAHNYYYTDYQLTPEILGDTVIKLTEVLQRSLTKAQLKDPRTKYVRDLDIVGLREVYVADYRDRVKNVKIIETTT